MPIAHRILHDEFVLKRWRKARLQTTIRHVGGEMEPATRRGLRPLLAELAHADDEHPDVSISDEHAWTLIAHKSGKVFWENVEEGATVGPQHLENVSSEEALALFQSLFDGRRADVESQPWLAGY